MTIGERIKNRRIELGMTQQELAEKVGYRGKTAISKIESGERDLRQSKIKPMAEALETTTEYIMGWDKEINEVIEYDKDLVKSLKDLYLLRLLETMSAEEKEDLTDYIKYLISKRKS